jgi:hypothetical protein
MFDIRLIPQSRHQKVSLEYFWSLMGLQSLTGVKFVHLGIIIWLQWIF